MKKRLLAVCLAVILMFSLCGCAFRKTQGEPKTDTIYYGYNNLTFVQQGIYDEILEEAVAMKTEFELFDATEQDVITAYSVLVYDHPELFWLADGYNYTLYNYLDFIPFLDLHSIDFIAACMEIDDDFNSKKEALDKKVTEITEQANAFETDYEKALFVHDYIIKNTEYDQKTADIITETEELTEVYSAQTAYGCLVEGKAICSGYSEAFQLIMQNLGFVCGNSFGNTIEDKQPHQWNYLQLDNEYYFVDVTWDDTGAQDNVPEFDCYEYFLITEDEIAVSHELQNEYLIPVCEGTKFDYYKSNGMYDSENYDYATTKEIIKAQLGEKQIVIKYSSPEECQKAVKALFENNNIFNVSSKLNKLIYFVGNTECVLYIFEQ